MKLLYTDIAYLRYRDLSQKRETQQIFDRYFPTHHKALLYIFNIIKQNCIVTLQSGLYGLVRHSASGLLYSVGFASTHEFPVRIHTKKKLN